MTESDRERLGRMIEVLTRSDARGALPAPSTVVEGSLAGPMAESDEPGDRDTPQPPTRGTKRGTARSPKGTGQAAIKLVPYRNDARTFEDLRTMGYSLLDVQAVKTQRELREKLGCRNDTAAAILTAWRNTQRGQVREA
jgi:hypothetical protein